MKTNYLFPYKWKIASGILFTLSFACLVAVFFFDDASFEFRANVFNFLGQKELAEKFFFSIIDETIIDEILMLFVIPAGIIFAFSKEKQEDEMVASIRLQSLAWATIINYGILLLCYMFIYGMVFLDVLMGAMFSQLLIFIILFRFKIYRLNTTRTDEE